ncbi:MAG: hypothetical protein JOY55_15530 [Mycobacterium sp.]|nr:hypothetical protein [Mycobacterium sp.]
MTLHAEQVYVQAGQNSLGLLFRTCRGREDYGGGPDQWARLDDLNRPAPQGDAGRDGF